MVLVEVDVVVLLVEEVVLVEVVVVVVQLSPERVTLVS